jgi:hypothetical protein
MPDDGRNGGGRFPNRPTDFDVSQFKDFVKQTGEPEHYPKLAHTPPDRTMVMKCFGTFMSRERHDPMGIISHARLATVAPSTPTDF